LDTTVLTTEAEYSKKDWTEHILHFKKSLYEGFGGCRTQGQ